MTENTQASQYSRADEEKEAIRAETMADGRYIPYSGGIMTWFENSGVLKCEQRNNYRFHEMVDVEAVRMKLFERWGDGESVNRRVSERFALRKPIHVALATPAGATTSCTAKDYSSHGLRLQIPVTPEITFAKGDPLRVVIFDNPESGKILFDISSVVMWVTDVGKTRETVSIGIAYMDLALERRRALLEYIRS